jgi:hypothetical protein
LNFQKLSFQLKISVCTKNFISKPKRPRGQQNMRFYLSDVTNENSKLQNSFCCNFVVRKLLKKGTGSLLGVKK